MKTPTPPKFRSWFAFKCLSLTGAILAISAAAPNLLANQSPDTSPPALVRASGGAGGNSVALVFSERLDAASAQTAGNYSIAGLTIASAKLNAAATTVILTTGAQTADASYTVTVNGVKDTSGNTLSGGAASFTAAKLVPNKLLVRLYRGFGGTAVADLVNNPKYPGSPDEVFLWEEFSSGENTGDVFGDNYGGEITGFVTPPVTGDYKFYIRSDDASQLWLSTDDTEGGLRQIAAQTGCCNAFTDAPGTLSSQPIRLESGKRYFVRAFWKEGGGGDWIQVGWLGPNDGDINDPSLVVPISAEFISTGFSTVATLAITQQPANISVAANTPASFTVGYNANSVLGTAAAIRWQKAPAGGANFSDIPGAAGPAYTIPFASAGDNGAQYRAVLTAGSSDPVFGTQTTATSNPATLTVTGDAVAPVLNRVVGGVAKISALFSEPLETASATATANYSINGGPRVTAARVISASGAAGVVELDVTGITPGQSYTLSVTGVKDTAGNTMANTSKTFDAFHIFSAFDDGLVPSGAVVAGSVSFKPSGSHDGSGFIELTPAAGSQQGSIFYSDPIEGAEVRRFTATFKLFIGRGSGNPADGFSFNIASDLFTDPENPGTFGEEGRGGGLTVAFDTYDNGGGEAPAISLKWGGTEFTTKNVSKATLVNNQWVDVVIKVDADGTIDVVHNNVKHYDNEPIPDWAPIAAAQIGLGGRTGGELEVHWIDDFKVIFNADVVLPQPPTIQITSPANNASIPAGANVVIQVDARDPENQVAKVEFFANGVKIGESTAAPYSFAIPNAPVGAYVVTAKVTDAQGLAVTSDPIKAVVGNPDKILFIHGTGGPGATDQLIVNRLTALGYNVVTVGDAASEPGDAAGAVLIITSSTVGSGNVAGKFDNTTLPVVNWEAALQDNYLFALDQDGVTRGVLGGQTQLEILTPNHPLAAGLTGTAAIADAGVEFSWGVPAPSAIVIGRLTDGNGRAGLYAFEKGAALIDGTIAAGRRVHFPAGDNTYAGLNADGLKLFDAAVAWAIGKAVAAPAKISISVSGAQITITSSNGGTVQATDNLATPNWQDVGPAPQNVTASGQQRYFRIRN